MLDLKKEELRKQLIEIKKQYYKNILKKIIKKQRMSNVIRIDILGITERLASTEVLYRITKRDKQTEIYELSVKIGDKTLYKITKPDSQTIEVNTDFWLFKEDVEG